MAASNAVLKRIVEECCRPLSYDRKLRQFSFPLRGGLDEVWANLGEYLKKNAASFYLEDFNRLLDRLDNPDAQHGSIDELHVPDTMLLNGEVLLLHLHGAGAPLRLVKMKRGEYLRCDNGNGISLGSRFEFKVGDDIVSSEGYSFGQLEALSILTPSAEHLALGALYIGKYYRHLVGDTLWPLHAKVASATDDELSSNCGLYLETARRMGLSAFSMLNIINAAVKWK